MSQQSNSSQRAPF